MKQVVSAVLILFSIAEMKAQNLVPNPSFEKYKKCPKDFNMSSLEWPSGPDSWHSPTEGTPDYYNKCSVSDRFDCDLQKPKTGNGYVGLFIYSPMWAGGGPEYVYTSLDSALRKDELYRIRFYISLEDNSRFVSSFFGLYLSENSPAMKKSFNGLLYSPQIANSSGLLSNDSEWVEISEVYKAKGGEKYVTLGSFISDNNDGGKYRSVPNRQGSSLEQFAYYFIDDVSIVHVLNKYDVGNPVVLKNIEFKTGKSDLLPLSFPELDQLVTALKQDSKSVEVSGHTDNSGKESENLKLSTARAKAVTDYLISKGIEKGRLKFKGYGSSKPIAKNDTEEGKQQNRRVEIEFIK